MKKICTLCGIEYEAGSQRRKYCSFKCSNTARRRGVTRKCKVCDKEFYVSPSEIHTHFYCSNACSSEGKKTGRYKKCPTCGGNVYYTEGTKFRKIFCSRQCSVRHTIKQCVVCGSEFKIKNSKSKKTLCCSWVCKNKNQKNKKGQKNNNWKGGISTQNAIDRGSINCKEWRVAVFARDLFTCQICGYKGKDINAHHIRPWKQFVAYRYMVENGITLCKKCHRHIHNTKDSKYLILHDQALTNDCP